jgi:hypothetical protein
MVLMGVVGTAALTSGAGTQGVPLAGIKLVAETSVPPAEVAAAAKNGNKNGNSNNGANAAGAGTAAFGFFGSHRDLQSSLGELVTVDIR